MPEYTVKQGDCISSIAHQHGLLPKKIWDHPDNAQLKENREDLNILKPGDVVFVPEKEEKEESGATEQRHRFRKKGVPAKLRLQLKTGDKPRADESYILDIDGEVFSGATDGDGKLEHPVPPNAKRGLLLVGGNQEEYVLNLGHIDPIDEVSGVQARLNNLGFDCGKVDGVRGPKTEAAIKEFQKQYDLNETGNMDQQASEKLREVYGC